MLAGLGHSKVEALLDEKQRAAFRSVKDATAGEWQHFKQRIEAVKKKVGAP